MLRLHAEAVAELIHPAALAGQRAIEEISRIELKARFVGGHFQHASARRLGSARHPSGPARGKCPPTNNRRASATPPSPRCPANPAACSRHAPSNPAAAIPAPRPRQPPTSTPAAPETSGGN